MNLSGLDPNGRPGTTRMEEPAYRACSRITLRRHLGPQSTVGKNVIVKASTSFASSLTSQPRALTVPARGPFQLG